MRTFDESMRRSINLEASEDENLLYSILRCSVIFLWSIMEQVCRSQIQSRTISLLATLNITA